MVRGADTQFQFKIPYMCSDLHVVKIFFWQPENNGPSTDRPLPIIKKLEQCFFDNDSNQLNVILDREETLRFSDKRKAYVQMNALTNSGVSFSSPRKLIKVYPCGNDDWMDLMTPYPTINEYIYFDGQNIGEASDANSEYYDAGTI